MDTTIAAAPLDVDAITARADAASPGEWYVNDENDGEGPAPHWVVANEAWVDCNYIPEGSATLHTDEWLSKADAEFIAHARTDIPALLAALAAERDRADRAEAKSAALESRRGELVDYFNHPKTPRFEYSYEGVSEGPDVLDLKQVQAAVSAPLDRPVAEYVAEKCEATA